MFVDRTAKIFVSSTFGEFANEREAIARKVLPELQRRASHRGVHVAAIDLRWGVTRAELAAGTVIERCFRELDVAYPFFLGLLGEQHGTRLDKASRSWGDELEWLAREAGKASITELEIKYAMLHPNRTNPSALIYYRARRSPFMAKTPAIAAEFRPLLAALQQRGYEAYVIGDQFEEHVTEKLWEIVNRHYPGVGHSHVAHDDDFRKHRQYGLQCAAAMPVAVEPLRECAQAILREDVGRIACTSSWEATAFAGALSIEVRKKTSALTFEHYLR